MFKKVNILVQNWNISFSILVLYKYKSSNLLWMIHSSNYIPFANEP